MNYNYLIWQKPTVVFTILELNQVVNFLRVADKSHALREYLQKLISYAIDTKSNNIELQENDEDMVKVVEWVSLALQHARKAATIARESELNGHRIRI